MERENQEFKEQLDHVNEQLADVTLNQDVNPTSDKYLQKICSAEIIKPGDELRICKDYTSKKDKRPKMVNIRCRATNIENNKLFVVLIGYGEKQNVISSLNKLEKWLLDEFKLDEEYRPKDYHNSTNNISIMREKKLIGTIREEYKKYKTLKNN